MEPMPGFKITCRKCGSGNVYCDDSRGWSEETGEYGSLDFRCRMCRNEQDIDSLRRELNEKNDK